MPTTPTSSIGLLEDNLKALTLKDGIVSDCIDGEQSLYLDMKRPLFTSTNIHAQYRKVTEETVFLPK